MKPAVMDPAATTMPPSGFEPQFQPQGLGMTSRYERLPGHLANLFDNLAQSANETAFLNQTARRALKGETLDQQDEADGARKAKTLTEFMNEASNQDEISFANSIADLKDAIRSRPGAPKVVAPQAPNIGQVLASVFGAALDPKNAAAIASLPGQEGMRQQQVDQAASDRQYQAALDQQKANVDVAKLGVDVAQGKLQDSRALGTAEYNAQQQAAAIARQETANARKERQDFAEKLIGKRVKNAGDLSQLQAAAKIAGYDLSPEFLDQAAADIEEEKQFGAARKRLDTLTASLRNSTDQQSRTAIRAEIVSLAQTMPDAFPNPQELIAAYGGAAMPTAQEKLDTAKITGQKVVDLLNQAKIRLTSALTSKIKLLTPMEAQQYAARVDLLTAQYGVAQAQAAQIAIENEWLPAEKQAAIAKARASVESAVNGGETKISDIKAGYSVVDGEIKELRDELKTNREIASNWATEESEKSAAKTRIAQIEKELATMKKDRDTFGELIKGRSIQVTFPPVDGGKNAPSGRIGAGTIKTKRPRIDSTKATPKNSNVPGIVSTKVIRGAK